ncbi:Crp/Fnr family transcriptional regulator [Rhizobium sp. YIM 134829]|uniref:Crp/Fnr family transcriptional regulator n=1 Tax=Rhizobium sp. YIM 134829 TaxID=3390453 RepID=UPI00397A886A
MAPYLKPVELQLRQRLSRPGDPLDHVCFIESGLASMSIESRDGVLQEIRIIGQEGLIGHSALLGSQQWAYVTVVQIEGVGLEVPVKALVDSLDLPDIRAFFHHYVHVCDVELAETALAAAKYTMRQRLARWLLMCEDRIDSDYLPLTHDSLARSLGVRRAGITDQLHVLEGEHVIRSTRRMVRILDRSMLVHIAGGCYGAPKEAYERLLGDHHEPANGTLLPGVAEPALVRAAPVYRSMTA